MKIQYSDGRQVEVVNLEEAQGILSSAYPNGCGEHACEGYLYWEYAEDAVDDDGSRAIAVVRFVSTWDDPIFRDGI